MKNNIEDIYPLSPTQEGMLFHTLRAPESGVYVEQLVLTLHTSRPLDEAAFLDAWQQTLARHAALRTAFVWEKREKPLQVVLRQVQLPFIRQDCRHLSPTEQETHLQLFLQADRQRGFDLSKAPLVRLALFQIADDAYQAVATFHHIIKDGWSGPIILRDVLTFYEFRGHSTAPPLLPSPRPYRDYIAWLQRQDTAQAEAFWRQTLRGFTAATPFSVDAINGGDVHYAQVQATLPAGVTAQLTDLARQHQLTLSTLVQGAWAMLLSAYSGAEDVVFGVTMAGRPAELDGLTETVGLFINTLPLRARLSGEQKLIPWLQRLQTDLLTVRAHEHSSLAEVQRWSDVPPGKPLFESIVVFENYPLGAPAASGSSSIAVRSVRSVEQTNYPLTLAALPGTSLSLLLDYEQGRFSADTASRLLGHLQTLLQQFVADPQQSLCRISLLTEPERRQLAQMWNQTGRNFPLGVPVHALFRQQAQYQPEQTALIWGDAQSMAASLTYAELEQQANQLAHLLLERGIQVEDRVGIYMERSLHLIVSVWAALKAGACFVPLDPAYPPERLGFMALDAGISLLLTQHTLLTARPISVPAHCDIVSIEQETAALSTQGAAPPAVQVGGNNLAYLIYTSGSTGKPKGVLMPHYGLGSMAYSQIEAFAVGPNSRVLQFASFSFDVAITEILMALLSGGTLVLAPAAALLPGPGLLALLRQRQITTITLTPSILQTLPDEPLPDLETIIVVGEPCPAELARRWSRGRHFVNAYGPTETVCAAIAAPMNMARPQAVGQPMGNTRIYVCDAYLRLLPAGVPGELLIESVSLARGYHNQPALTAQQFIPNPFTNERVALDSPRQRLYRSGDAGRWLPDGTLEFLGRLDNQVKINGVRVELGEIENSLNEHPGVRESALLWRNGADGSPQLTAYIVPAAAPGPSAGELRRFLQQTLPASMIPTTFVRLPAMPLTPNGKVDHHALPIPPSVSTPPPQPYAPPRTPDEETMARIWAECLQRESVGIYDNFWELGGHSLLAARIVARAQKAFQVDLPLPALFTAPNVAALTAHIHELRLERQEHEQEIIPRADRQSPLPLSFAQERLWFLNQLMPANPFYNITTAVALQGTLDVTALANSLNALIERHEALRTVFPVIDGQPIQLILPPFPLPITHADLRQTLEAASQDAQEQELARRQYQQPFDLAQGPLLRALLVQRSAELHHLYLTIHHIVSDGWSLGVLLREIGQLYQANLTGQPAALPGLPRQYADYAVWQRGWLSGDVFAAHLLRPQLLRPQLAYWQAKLSNLPTLSLPTDYPRPAVPTFVGQTISFTLPPALVRALRALSQQEELSLFTLTLAAFQTLLYRYTDQTDVVVGVPVANRQRVELEGLIGFFVNTLALRADLSGEPSFRALLQRVRIVTEEAFAHQDVPFEKVVEALQPERDLSRNPLFQVAFVYQNAPLPALKMSGLRLVPLELDTGVSRSDLELQLWETADSGKDVMRGSLTYSAELFSSHTAARLAAHFQTLLTSLVANPDAPISHHSLLTAAEQTQLRQWNASDHPLPDVAGWHHCFAAQAARTPHLPALLDDGVSLTYAELNARANQLAHALQKRGVGPETLVALCLERSPEMIVALLGILKAGGAYLPLDPAYPASRLSFILADSGAALLLTQTDLRPIFPPDTPPVMDLSQAWSQIVHESTADPTTPTHPDQLAYVIYTSGTTGQPKGVLVPHRGLINVSQAQAAMFKLQAGEPARQTRVLQFASLSFDASIFEIVMALSVGATLCLATPEKLLPGAPLLNFLQQQRINLAVLPPSVLAVVPAGELPHLHTITVAGEACPAEVAQTWAPGRAFFNLYGPTEATIWTTAELVDATYPHPAAGKMSPPIGRPIANVRVYVLDRQMQPVPVGVPGELYIGGVGVTRGYLRRPGLTAASFLPDPFAGQPGARLYRSGDLVRFLPDGRLEFLGRVDQQIKLRGFRIEPGEIEAALRQVAGIRAALVIAREDVPGDKRLVAYLVWDGASLPVAQLRHFLQQRLPPHMIPSAFVNLPALPLNPNGKIERRDLPAPEQSQTRVTQTYVPPRTHAEEVIAGIWQQHLHREQISVHDNFFDLGGHSLLLVRVHQEIITALQRPDIPLTDLFKYPTIASLSRHLSGEAAPEKMLAAAQTPAAARRDFLRRVSTGNDSRQRG
ncbi:MAG: hypothetical protein Fur0021_16520 [Candidatus Promineifilaceae bacterium]